MNIPIMLLATLLLTGGRGWASDVQILLDSDTITASPGQQITFSGVLANNDMEPVDLNDIDVTLDGMFVVDTSDFFSGPPTVDASTPLVLSKTVDFDLFTVMVDLPYTDTFGVNNGILTILGGVETNGYDPTTQNDLGSVTFQLNVTGPVVTPEPSSFVLFAAATGLMCLSRCLASARRMNIKHR